MQKNKLFLFLIFCFVQINLFAQDQNALDYIETYKTLAINEQLRTGVPAAITLAQGLHESANGLSELATQGNNHFGIKCKSTWTGKTILHDDDAKQECFRAYDSASDSYTDHSDYLRASKRYNALFELEITDYVGWAQGLKRAGYATNPMYVKRLVDLIEKYNLQQYTLSAMSMQAEVVPEHDIENNYNAETAIHKPLSNTNTASSAKLFEDNTYKGLTGFWAKKGETLLSYAVKYNTRYQKLLSNNDLADKPLEQDMFIFLEKKKKIGTEEFHIVQANENMHLISQKEAILLDNLYYFNNMIPGEEPYPNEKLSLQYKSYNKPKIKPQFLDVFEEKKTNDNVIIVKKENNPTPEVKQENIQNAEHNIETKEAIIEEAIPAPNAKELNVDITETTPSEPVAKTETETKIEEIQEESRAIVEIQEEKIQNETQTKTTEPQITETVVADKEIILDENKAQKTAALLGAEINDAYVTKIDTLVATEIQEQSTESIPTLKQEELVQVETKTKPFQSEIPKEILERKYNEPNVSDSVKNLKKRFDKIIYKTYPPRVKKETNTQIKKEVEAPKKVEKATTQTTSTKKPEPTPKKETIIKTSTGIKKTSGTTKSDAKQKTSTTSTKKTDTKSNSKTSEKKPETKKPITKKTSDSNTKKTDTKAKAKNTKDTKKETTTKKKK
ncbi:MAG: glucosaminidase domain-containing protein [Chitinophagaceae bacterium]